MFFKEISDWQKEKSCQNPKRGEEITKKNAKGHFTYITARAHHL